MFHIGSARTALFNWLYARHTGGTFILRVEDTDAQRNKPEYVEVIFHAMKWLGMDWDEGPQPGGAVTCGGSATTISSTPGFSRSAAMLHSSIALPFNWTNALGPRDPRRSPWPAATTSATAISNRYRRLARVPASLERDSSSSR